MHVHRKYMVCSYASLYQTMTTLGGQYTINAICFAMCIYIITCIHTIQIDLQWSNETVVSFTNAFTCGNSEMIVIILMMAYNVAWNPEFRFDSWSKLIYAYLPTWTFLPPSLSAWLPAYLCTYYLPAYMDRFGSYLKFVQNVVKYLTWVFS